MSGGLQGLSRALRNTGHVAASNSLSARVTNPANLKLTLRHNAFRVMSIATGKLTGSYTLPGPQKHVESWPTTLKQCQGSIALHTLRLLNPANPYMEISKHCELPTIRFLDVGPLFWDATTYTPAHPPWRRPIPGQGLRAGQSLLV